MSENNNFKIAKDIVASYEARLKVVQATVEDTKRLLEEFREKRERMSQELKEALSKHESLRKKDFDKMMEGILVAQSSREENVKQMLADFQEEEMAVVRNLREMLKGGEKLRLKDFKKTLTKIKEEQEIREKLEIHRRHMPSTSREVSECLGWIDALKWVLG